MIDTSEASIEIINEFSRQNHITFNLTELLLQKLFPQIKITYQSSSLIKETKQRNLFVKTILSFQIESGRKQSKEKQIQNVLIP